MWFRPQGQATFKPGEIPEDVYIRPHGHLEWLKEKAKTIPVFLNADPPADWPANARKFPVDDVRGILKARPDQDMYSASSPAPILAHLIVRGFTEIHIYGIHLATEKEYREQRPNFEWLMGKAEAMGVNIVLPPSCPLLKHSHVYAYEHAPKRPDAAALARLRKAQQEFQQLSSTLVRWPRWKSKASELARLTRLKAEIHDAQQQGRHALVRAGTGG
jgi:hypothetical protein